MIRVGIIGLPNVGKSTLFNTITNSSVEAENYPFVTIDPNISIIDVKDERIDFLANAYSTNVKKYNRIQFYDIAGLVRNAHKGEGLGNKFLNNIREVDTIVHLLRGFDDEKIIHVEKDVNLERDLKIINLELIFSDLEQIENWLTKNQRKILHSSDKKERVTLELLKNVKLILEKEDFLFNYKFTIEEQKILRNFNFLSNKPILYVINISENEITEEINSKTQEFIDSFLIKNKFDFELISVQFENELSKLDEENKKEFLDDLNIKNSGFNNFINKIFKLSNVETFFTAGPKEVKAWQIKRGTFAPSAAGEIHSDIERGFIKVEIIAFDDFFKFPSEKALKEKGLIALQGREYIIKDGDICNFKFNI